MEYGIDFEEASRSWRSNKICLPGGNFKYRCLYVHRNGKVCSQSRLPDLSTCWRHM